MPTQINNTASATYGFGRSRTDNAISNIATTNLLSEYSLTSRKLAPVAEFRPGDNVSYFIQVTNTGSSALQSVTVVDDLGGATGPLNYIDASAYLNINGNITALNPTTTTPSLTFVLPGGLQPNEIATISYVARVDSAIDPATQSIVNVATVTGTDATGGTVASDVNPTATITLEDFADVQIVKTVSAEEITAGNPFSYVITLENSGNAEARDVVITDVLPTGFVVNSITSNTDGTLTVFDAQNYTVETSTNTLTLPNNASTQSIVVPPVTSTTSGRTVVTITGVINN